MLARVRVYVLVCRVRLLSRPLVVRQLALLFHWMDEGEVNDEGRSVRAEV